MRSRRFSLQALCREHGPRRSGLGSTAKGKALSPRGARTATPEQPPNRSPARTHAGGVVRGRCWSGPARRAGQERLAARISSSNERRDEVPSVLEAEVVGAEIALERWAVADFPPRQTPTLATQRIHAAAHRATGTEESGDCSKIRAIQLPPLTTISCGQTPRAARFATIGGQQWS